MFTDIQELVANFSSWIWGMPLLILLIGGGLYLFVYSSLVPFKYMGHAIAILRGKYDKKDSPGDLSHYEALSSAIAATVGMGNISGVAIAIAMGGPGAIFWMWVSAFVGMATKFFTCTLAIMYRGEDEEGNAKGGPMYVITEGLGKKWLPLAWIFCLGGMFGALPIFQINQLVQVLRDFIAIPHGLATASDHFSFDLTAGILLCFLIAYIVMGKLERLAKITSRVIPILSLIHI